MTKVTPRFKPPPARHHIRSWRKHRGYSQEQLAEMIGVTHSAISQLENGKISYTQPMLEALAEALNAPPAALLGVDPSGDCEMWSIWEKAKPAERTQIKAIAETVVKLSA